MDEERRKGNEILKNQLEFYKKQDVMVHIETTSGRYYRGKILEISSDMVIIDERLLGAMPIYFIEIKILEKCRDRNG